MPKYDYVDVRLDGETRDKIVIIRMTNTELDICKVKAAKRKRSMSDYVRCLVFNDDIQEKLL